MGQYKRMVSYLYKYINGAKSQNTGFVRIELMDVQCRFTVQMRMVPFEVFPKVYLYIQKEHGAKCIEVSDMGTKSGNLVSRFALDKNNIEQTGYSFDDIDGLVVYISDEMFFATSWVRDVTSAVPTALFQKSEVITEVFQWIILSHRQNILLQTEQRNLSLSHRRLPFTVRIFMAKRVCQSF